MQAAETNAKTVPPTHRPNGQFAPGNQLGGRPKGSRHQFAEAFLKDVLDVWKNHGRAALMEMIMTDPGGFVRAAATLVPKEAKLQVEDFRTLVVSLVGAQEPAPEAIEGEATQLLEEQPADDTEPLRAFDGYTTRS